MNITWLLISSPEQVEYIEERSKTVPQLIFKHSTRCHISSMIKNRLEKSMAPGSIEFHYLDLLRYRTISDKIAHEFNVNHESPQVLLIKNAECVYEESHTGIRMENLVDSL